MSIANLRPAGILDAEVGRSLLARIESDLSRDFTIFHLDCSEITSIDEQGLEFLLQALRLINDTQGRLLIFSVNQDVRAFFVDRGLDLVIELYD
jgi:anti-anti-sigma regulatory factor